MDIKKWFFMIMFNGGYLIIEKNFIILLYIIVYLIVYNSNIFKKLIVL